MSTKKKNRKSRPQQLDFNNVISRDWLMQRLYMAFIKARKGKLSTQDEFLFEIDWYENLERLADDIMTNKYKPSRGVAFIIKKPVIREIFAAPFRDRVVHHFLYDMVAEWWDDRLVYNSASCRKGKGVLFGIKRLDKDIRQVSQNYQKEAYVLKFDIQGYFMSLPRKELYRRMVKGLRKQYRRGGPVFQLIKYLWREVIFDDPVDGVKKRSPDELWDLLAHNKSLLHQPPGYGIVIGNLSSQLLSNIYLDQLDQFVTKKLGYKHYGRYVDDFYIVVSRAQYEQAKRDVKVIEEYLLSLGLVLHPNKRYCQNIKKGVAYLGVVVYPHRIVPGKRFKGEFFRAVYECMIGFRSVEAITSYLGYCKHVDAKKLCAKVFSSVGWEYKY